MAGMLPWWLCFRWELLLLLLLVCGVAPLLLPLLLPASGPHCNG
jgi:hypothetical protein